jgi:hypothetical protein
MESHLNQIVIYGANGWLGRSSVEATLRLFPGIDSETILLIGSRDGQVKILDRDFKVYNPTLGESRIKKNSIFLNCAFLRREYVERLGQQAFLLQNKKIMDLPIRVLHSSNVSNFVNLSSGVAALENSDKDFTFDSYASLKKQSEIDFARFCKESTSLFLNCRVYSVTGYHINEFKNLALSSFIHQAITKKFIKVESPDSKRVYIDGVNLMTVLLRLALDGESGTLDSGGHCVSLQELAGSVLKIVGLNSSNLEIGVAVGNLYFGDFEYFNTLAAKMGESILDIDSQVENTLRAFKQKKWIQ